MVLSSQILTGIQPEAVPSAAVDNLLSRLDNVRRSGKGWSARCPAHDDHDTTNQPASGAKVVISDPLSALGTTDSNGDVTIANVAPGNWTVKAGGTLVPVTLGEAFVTPGQTRAASPQPTVYQPQQTPTTTVTQTIGPAGGTLSVPGVLDLTIPANALISNQRLRVATYASNDPTRFYAWRIEPLELYFNTPASLTFHYTDAQLAAWGVTDPGRPGQVVISQYQKVATGMLPRELPLPTSVNKSARTITAWLNQTGTPANNGLLTVQGFHAQAVGDISLTVVNPYLRVGESAFFNVTVPGDISSPDLTLQASLRAPGAVGSGDTPGGTDPAGMTLKSSEQLDVGAEAVLPFAPLPSPTPTPTATPTASPTSSPSGNPPSNPHPPSDIAISKTGQSGQTGALNQCGTYTLTPQVLDNGIPVRHGNSAQIHVSNGILPHQWGGDGFATQRSEGRWLPYSALSPL